jgi:hypothetical protein
MKSITVLLLVCMLGLVGVTGCATTGPLVVDVNAIASGFAQGVVKVLSDPNGPLAQNLAKDLAKYPQFAPAIAFAATMNWADKTQVQMLTEMLTIAALETGLGNKQAKSQIILK